METTTQVKDKEGTYTIGIDIRNSDELVRMGKLVEKKSAVPLNRYYTNRTHFRCKEKFLN